nr:hypothetical protein [Tanacetum cinerariifolium]
MTDFVPGRVVIDAAQRKRVKYKAKFDKREGVNKMLDKQEELIFRDYVLEFCSRAWNELFRTEEPVIHEYDLEFLSTVAKFLAEKGKGAQKKSKIMGAHLIGRIAWYFSLMCATALSAVTWGQDTTLYNVVKLEDIMIVRFNRAGLAEMVDEMLDNSDEEAEAAEARMAQDEDDDAST